jgi:hypothetical protein
MTAEERRRRHLESLEATRLRVAIREEIRRRGLRAEEMGWARQMPADAAIKLLHRKQWRVGDLATLRKVAEEVWPVLER